MRYEITYKVMLNFELKARKLPGRFLNYFFTVFYFNIFFFSKFLRNDCTDFDEKFLSRHRVTKTTKSIIVVLLFIIKSIFVAMCLLKIFLSKFFTVLKITNLLVTTFFYYYYYDYFLQII